MIYPKILSVKALEKYRVYIQFEDAVEGILELSDYAGKEAFKQWDVDDNFSKVSINEESGAITWPGNLDIDTLTAWLTLKGLSYDEYKSKLKKQSHAIR
jgi:hypothetical protein